MSNDNNDWRLSYRRELDPFYLSKIYWHFQTLNALIFQETFSLRDNAEVDDNIESISNGNEKSWVFASPGSYERSIHELLRWFTTKLVGGF